MNKSEKIVVKLAQSSSKAAPDLQFDLIADLRMLHAQYTKTSKRDYLQLLQRLIEKYTATEQATVHAALVAKCKAGDAAAIKLYYEQQAAFADSEKGGAVIIDDIRGKGKS